MLYRPATPKRAPVRKPAAAVTRPFATLTPAQIQQQVAARTAGLPTVLTDPQLAARAQSQVDPLVAAITSRINARAQAGAGAIRGYTNQLAGDLGKYAGQAGNIYGQAQGAQAGSDAALAQMLTGQGGDLAANLGAKLQQAGMPQTVIDKTTGEAVQTGQGSAGALYGTGSASLSNLISQGASAQDYAAKLPGIAGLGGLQSMRDLQLQSQQQLGDQTAAVREQIPTILANLRAANDAARTNRATTANDTWRYLTGRNDTIAGNNRARADALSLGAAKNAATVQAAGLRAAGTVQAAKLKAATAATANDVRSGQQSFQNRLSFARTFGYDPLTGKTLPGYTIAPGGNVVKKTTAKGKAAPRLSAKQMQDYRGTAVTVAQNAKNGFDVTDQKTGTVTRHPPIDWAAALLEMDKEGIPRPIAIQALKRFYGDRDPATNPNAAGPIAP